MKNSSNSLDQKQTYLRSQIIDSGVDPEPFMVFMGAYKGQGENINLQNWTLFDLKKVVQQFKGSLELELNRQEQMSKITNQKAAINYRASQQVADRVMGSNLPKKQKVFYERDDLWDYQLKIDQQCKKTYQFFNFKSFPRISCKAIQVKKEGGFLFGIIGAKNYIEITLSPNFCSHTIARKSQDVDWLRASLVSLYPGSFVPPLEQTPVMQFQNKAIVGKRAKQILDFVNSLVHFDHLINNKFTHMFFTEGDQKLFQTFKQKNVVVPINNLKGIQTFEGHFPLEISQRIQDLVKKSSKYSKQVSGLYKNIQETMVKISNDYNSLNKNFIVLFKDLSKVKQKYQSLSQQCNIQKSPHNVEFDKRMMAMMKHLTDLVQTLQALSHKQANTIKEINEQHIKVMIKQWNQFDNLEARYKKQLDSYLAFRLSMYKKKQQFFLDLSKKQLQLRQKNGSTNETTLSQKQELYKAKYSGENKIQQDRRQWQGYLNYMYEKSFMNLLGEQEKQLQQKMSQVSRMFDKKLTQVAQKHHNFDKFLNDSGLIMVEQQVHQKK